MRCTRALPDGPNLPGRLPGSQPPEVLQIVAASTPAAVAVDERCPDGGHLALDLVQPPPETGVPHGGGLQASAGNAAGQPVQKLANVVIEDLLHAAHLPLPPLPPAGRAHILIT